MMNAKHIGLAAAVVVFAATASSPLVAESRRQSRDSRAASQSRIEDMSRGKIQVTVAADPARIEYHRDLILTVTITAPPAVDVSLPSLDDRLQGFMVTGVIDKESSDSEGMITRERRTLLAPLISEEHRLAPMAIVYTDRSRSPAESGWFPTKPIVFEVAPPLAGRPPKDIETSLKPLWIYPSFKTVAMYVMLAILAVAIAILVWKLTRRIQHQIKLMRMSPRERALYELSVLLAKDLITRNLVKEFYLELTMIVRRYIERRHSIRAPSQTTEEFLIAVANDQRFSLDVMASLKAFLEAADLVKFAAYHPAVETIGRATDTAREYIEKDAAEGAENVKRNA